MEEKIISPISREALKAELTPDHLLRRTNKGGNEIYVVTYQQAPNVVREVGRLREIVFRAAGGGTGKMLDLDEFDTCDHPYYQLVVWDPEDEVLLGGYRFLPGRDWTYDDSGQPILATSHMFHFSQDFLDNYAYSTCELGRSFVTLEYQNTRAMTKGLFALDNLWDGLGAISVIIPELRFFFGKMTMYPNFDRKARDMILYFLRKFFPDFDHLIYPTDPLQLTTDEAELAELLPEPTFKEAFRRLNMEVRKRGYNIPPLVNAYSGLSPTMRCFGTAVNHEFGEVEETGILIAVNEIVEQKYNRYINAFVEEHPDWSREFKNILITREE
ncbi:MAG: GNAT family N-acetyltransferase [Alloprevotella sp.]|nr:GNAT family N-acetyltransferase [Alloprevotella sp.]